MVIPTIHKHACESTGTTLVQLKSQEHSAHEMLNSTEKHNEQRNTELTTENKQPTESMKFAFHFRASNCSVFCQPDM